MAVAAGLAPGGAAAAAAAASGTEAAGAASGTSPRGPRGSARGGAEGSGGGAGGTGSGGAGRGEGGGRPRRGRQGREGSRGDNARGRGGGRNGRGARGLGDSAGGRSAGAMAGSLPPGVAPGGPLGTGGVPALPGGGRGLPAGVPMGIPPGNAQAASQVMAAAAAAGYYVSPMYYAHAAPFGALLAGGAPATAAAAGVPAPPAAGGVGAAVTPPAEGSPAASERLDPLQAFRLQVLAAAKTQAEYYFSVQNLCRDMFLRKQMDDQGWISVQVILGFNRVRQILSSLPEPPLAVLRAALEGSELVEFSPGGQEVRARGSWNQWVMPKEQRTPRTADGGAGGEVQPNGQRASPNGPGPSAKAGAGEEAATSPAAGDEASSKSSEKVRGEEGGAPNGVAVQAN